MLDQLGMDIENVIPHLPLAIIQKSRRAQGDLIICPRNKWIDEQLKKVMDVLERQVKSNVGQFIYFMRTIGCGSSQHLKKSTQFYFSFIFELMKTNQGITFVFNQASIQTR
jgi:hypothetical protein